MFEGVPLKRNPRETREIERERESESESETGAGGGLQRSVDEPPPHLRDPSVAQDTLGLFRMEIKGSLYLVMSPLLWMDSVLTVSCWPG